MVDTLSSKVAVLEEKPSVRTLPQLPTAVLGMVGLAERGPLDTPTVISSYDEFLRIFGELRSGELMGLCLRHAFLNGLNQAIVERVLGANYATGTVGLNTGAVAASAGSHTGSNAAPFNLSPGDTLVVAVDGGGNVTATFAATNAAVTAGSVETYVLSDGQTLTVSINGAAVQTITFNTADFSNIALATAAEVAAVINQDIVGAGADVVGGAPRIFTDRYGTGASVQVTGGTANAVLGFSTTQVDGTGDVADIDAVTVAEVKTVVEADIAGLTVNDVGGAVQLVSNTTGAGSSILVDASSTADGIFGFDNVIHSGSATAATPTITVDANSPGAWANGAGGTGLQIEIDPPSNGVVTGADAAFNLIVLKGGVAVETFANVTMNSTSDQYFATVINDTTTGSNYIVVTDLGAAVAAPNNRPAEGTFDMASGSDGDPVSDSTFTGGVDPDAGLNAMEAAQITLLAIPDRATAAVQTEMVTFCEVTKNREVFAIFDPPALMDVAGIRAHKASLPVSEMYALYWPRVRIANPDPTVLGTAANIVIPPSGAIAGMMARNDAATRVGPYTQPAGVEEGVLFSVVGLESDLPLRESNRDLVFPELINPLNIPEEGGGVYVDGARTGQSNGNFPSVGERRGISADERVLKRGLQWVRHKNNTKALRASADRTARGYFRGRTEDGAYASNIPSQAFVLDADVPGTGINNASVRAQKKFFIRVGVATAKPAEFVFIIVSQDTRAQQEAGA